MARVWFIGWMGRPFASWKTRLCRAADWRIALAMSSGTIVEFKDIRLRRMRQTR